MNKFSGDIAILEIRSLAKYFENNPGTSTVKAACLPEEEVPAGSHCWVAGWGHTTLDNIQNPELVPNILQEASVNKMSSEYCRDHSISDFNVIETPR